MKIPKRITLKIDVDKILAEHLYQGKKGKYLDVVLFNTPDNQFGADYVVKQDLPRDVRDAGTEAPILGNARVFEPNGGDTNQTVGAPSEQSGPQTPPQAAPNMNGHAKDNGLPF